MRPFADHGDATRDFGEATAVAAETLRLAERAGLDVAAMLAKGSRGSARRRRAAPTSAGRRSARGYDDLLACIGTNLRRTAPAVPAT
jgi:hypothetical protein